MPFKLTRTCDFHVWQIGHYGSKEHFNSMDVNLVIFILESSFEIT